MEKQEKLSIEDLEKYNNRFAGFAVPASQQAGFICICGIKKVPDDDVLFVIEDYESPDFLELVEVLKGLTKIRHDFRNADSLLHGGDFVFCDTKLRELLQLSKEGINVKHSGVLYNLDREKPFLSVGSRVKEAIKSGKIIIDDESKMAIRLKDDVLLNPAGLKFGDSPAFESLCFAYVGWQELVRKGNQPPRQENVQSEYERY